MSRDRVEIVAAGVKRRGLMEWDNNVRWVYWKIALEYSFFYMKELCLIWCLMVLKKFGKFHYLIRCTWKGRMSLI